MYHVLAALQKGRLVVTNLPLVVEMFGAIDPAYPALIELVYRPKPILGTWDASRVDGKGNGNAFELWPDGAPPADQGLEPSLPELVQKGRVRLRGPDPERIPSDVVFGGVWDYYHTWKHPETGQGPLFVIDECHVPLPSGATDPRVVEWFKLHRHFNADVLLMTQSFRDMNQPIARLIAMLIRCRKADILGKKDVYIRKVHSGYRGAVISTEERPYKPQFFPLYRSHTQGNSVAESAAQDVAPLYVKVQRLKWAVLAVGGVLTVWAWWPEGKSASAPAKPSWLVEAEKHRGKPLIPTAADVPTSPDAAAKKLAVVAPGASTNEQPSGAVGGPIPEPYGTKGLHLNGCLTMGRVTRCMVTISQNGAVVSTTSNSELERVGYVFKALGDCVATVQWLTTVRTITCDSPSITVAYQPTAAAAPAAK
ncbi:MAG TPA: zonular occludens toxin domain-containing protein [Ramlibacter sp.]|uniref:zonular occludens toxin domain-containing protein n=1 Tax=Ramlibacter sp. TaxID=1917967 RepID=UPI002D2D3792|nr:zonular occludens toxin domain-containing protein [Ramlibacter sp.]HZY18631.1 zonular occludens toxin domain-containing protein [Ramlibacter sp.]